MPATAAHRRVEAGIAWVVQERGIFPSLSVEENLAVAARPGSWTRARVYELFPRLLERRRNMGNQLSGGEQQMLAMARALAGNPALLLLDEPLEGLAPIIVQELSAVVRRLITESGLTMVVVEQHARAALAMTRRAIVLDRGRIVHDGASSELLDDQARLQRLLGVKTAKSAPQPST
jgi:branched-chain amino acid transport system ATP-binding protein